MENFSGVAKNLLSFKGPPCPIHSSGNVAFIKMTTDVLDERNGFTLMYSTIEIPITDGSKF